LYFDITVQETDLSG